MAQPPLVLVLLSLTVATDATPSSCAGGQHLICKAVEETLSDGCQGGSRLDQTVVRTRIGKAGPKGEKGEPATVDEETLDVLIEERVNLVTAELQMEIQKLENIIETMNATMADATSSVECRDGFLYHRKCYEFATSANRDVTLSKARQMCQQRGKKLAYILNLEHQYLLVEEMRKKINTDLDWTQVWLDMTYSATARTLHFGEQWSLASAFRWYTAFPDRSSSTSIGMESRKEPSSIYVGLFNLGPAHVTYGALCTV